MISYLQHVIREVLAEHEVIGFGLRVELVRSRQSNRQLRILEEGLNLIKF